MSSFLGIPSIAIKIIQIKSFCSEICQITPPKYQLSPDHLLNYKNIHFVSENGNGSEKQQ